MNKKTEKIREYCIIIEIPHEIVLQIEYFKQKYKLHHIENKSYASYIGLFHLKLINTNFKKIYELIKNITSNIKPFEVILNKVIYNQSKPNCLSFDIQFVNFNPRNLYDMIIASSYKSARPESYFGPHCVIGWTNDVLLNYEWKLNSFTVNNLSLVCCSEDVDFIEVPLAITNDSDSDSDEVSDIKKCVVC